MSTTVQFTTQDSTACGYLAEPPGGRGPAVIVLQEWWGLNPQLKGVCDRLAGQGFLALAPDLYHGALAAHDEVDKAGALMSELPPQRAAQDMSAAIDLLLDHPAREGTGVGVLGFCMGGLLALLLAAHRTEAVTVAMPFYGFPSGSTEPDWTAMQTVVRGHMAEQDGHFPPAEAHAVEARMRAAGVDVHFTFHDAGHAFMNEENGLGTYDETLAASLWPRIVATLREHLVPGTDR